MLTILAQKSLEMIEMSDPDLLVNKRPILREEVKEAGLINLSDQKMNIGFVQGLFKSETVELESIPAEMNPFTGIYDWNSFSSGDHMPLVSCKDQFSNVIKDVP